MPRYYFDVEDGYPRKDDVGTDCPDLEQAHLTAVRLLPDVARDELRMEDGRRMFTVILRDEQRRPLFVASLTFSPIWLVDER